MLRLNDNEILKSGQKIKRTRLNNIFNTSGQGGINPSNKNKLIFLFSDPQVGEKFGYQDGWKDGIFYYSGKGPKGDMQLTQVNKSIYETLKNQYKIYLFNGSRDEVVYENEFKLDLETPYIEKETLDKDNLLRTAIIFRLLPILKSETITLPESIIQLPKKNSSTTVSLEKNNKKYTKVKLNENDIIIEYREKELVERYAKYLKIKEQKILERKKIDILNDTTLYTDGWIEEDRILIEAKANTTRDNVRMAIGQLLDYARHIKPNPPEFFAILLPKRPTKDLVDLLFSLDIQIIYEKGSSFINEKK